MKAFKLFHCLVMSLLSVPVVANAAMLVALQNQEVSVAVNAELGSIFELPSAVKTITPSKYFSVTDLGGDTSTASGAGRTDVRTFQIKPIKGSRPENITFVLAGGKNISLRLSAASGAEKFYEVHLEGKRGAGAQKFLSSEMALMRAMLLDENAGFVRETVNTKISATSFKDFEFSLIRIYSSTELTGYVFKVKNKGKATATINAASFAIAKPNRAVLAQIDKERLDACPFFKTTPECSAILRFVLRGSKEIEPILGMVKNTTPPFVKSGNITEGGAQ